MSYLAGSSIGTLAAGGTDGRRSNTQLDSPCSVYFDSVSNGLIMANFDANNIVR
jgi:hypothetical protein